MEITDFLVHINESLEEEELSCLENCLRSRPGVVSAGHSASRIHLMMVAYDSDETRMSEIVGHIRKQGVEAQAVGM